MVKTKVLIFLAAFLLLALTGCEEFMTDEEFEEITEEYILRMIAYAQETGEDIDDMSEDFQEYADEALREIVTEYGYHPDEYHRKAADIGVGVEELTGDAQERLEGLIEVTDIEVPEE